MRGAGDFYSILARPKEDCSICQEPLSENVITHGKGHHLYHNSCLEKHIVTKINQGNPNITCPLCREKITSINDLIIERLRTKLNLQQRVNQFMTAVITNQVEYVRLTLDQNIISPENATAAFRFAVRCGHYAIVPLFLQRGSIPRHEVVAEFWGTSDLCLGTAFVMARHLYPQEVRISSYVGMAALAAYSLYFYY